MAERQVAVYQRQSMNIYIYLFLSSSSYLPKPNRFSGHVSLLPGMFLHLFRKAMGCVVKCYNGHQRHSRNKKNKTKINKSRKKSRRSSLLVDNRKTLLQTLDFSTHTALNCSSFYTDAIFLYISFETLLLSKQQSKSVESSRRSTAPLLCQLYLQKPRTHTHRGKEKVSECNTAQVFSQCRQSIQGQVYAAPKRAEASERESERKKADRLIEMEKERGQGRNRLD